MGSTLLSPERVSELQKLVNKTSRLQSLLSPQLCKYIPHTPTPKQTAFLLLPHREGFYGGAAGGGKSDALLMAALQYADSPNYNALLLRRTFRELSMPSALMDRAQQWLAPHRETRWRPNKATWEFPQGSTLTFGYLQHEHDVYQYDSAEFQFIGFDELTQFTESQYRFMFSRLRRLKGLPVPVRMRAASNPGGIGHIWVKERLVKNPSKARAFIRAWLEDNPHIDQEEYKLALAQLDSVLHAQRRYGDWDVDYEGSMFKRPWFSKFCSVVPVDVSRCRFWDFASTAGAGDFSVGALVSMDDDHRIFVEDIVRGQWGPASVEKVVKQTAKTDGEDTPIRIEQEPGSAGKMIIEGFIRMLPANDVGGVPSSGKKTTRWKPFAAQAEVGNIIIKSAPWNSDWIDEISGVPLTKYDDQADATSGAFNFLAKAIEEQDEFGIDFL